MILRSQPSGLTLASFCVVVVLFGGCAREDSARAAPDAVSSQSATDDLASEPVRTESAEASGLPANDPALSRSPSRDPAKLHRAALAALEAGDDDVAFDLGRQAMRVAPEDPQVIFLMAMILGKRNRFPEAIQMLDELAERTPAARLPAMGQTADWMVRFGQWSDAENRYRAILKEVPESALVHRNLAQLMIRQGRRIEAAEHLGHLCRLGEIQEVELRSLLSLVHPFPGDAENEEFDPVGALGIARNEIGRGDWEAARERLENLDSLQPEEMALLGRIDAHVGDFEALEPWMANLSKETDLHADAWFAKGALAAWKGDHANAIRCLAEVVLRDQTDHEAYALMSQSLEELDAPKEAEEAKRRAELIAQTQTLGAEMAAATNRDEAKLSTMIQLLEQLHRPLEALAWRGVQLGYTRNMSSMPDVEVQQALSEITRNRSEQLKANLGQATRSFVLCGVDLDAFPSEAQSAEAARQAVRE